MRRGSLGLFALLSILGTSVQAADPDYHSPRRLAVTTDGTMVAVASADKHVRIWDAETGRLLHALATEQPLTSVAFAGKDGDVVAGTEGRESTVFIWKQREGKYQLASKTPLQGSVTALTTSPDGKWAVAVGSQARTYFIDLAEGKLRRTWQELGNPMADVAFSPDGKTLISMGQTFRYWDTRWEELQGSVVAGFVVSEEQRLQDEKKYLRLRTGCGETVAPLPNGEWVAAVGWFVNNQGKSSDLALLDAKTGITRKILSTTMQGVTFLAATPDSKTLAIGIDSDLVELWSLVDGKKSAVIKCEGVWRLRSGAFLKEGKVLAVTNEGGSRVETFDLPTGKSLRRLHP